MIDSLSILLGPEACMTALTVYVFRFCRRHPSGEGKDIAAVEKLLMRLPFLAAVIAFATFFLPSLEDWSGLGRINLAYFIAVVVGSVRLLGAFGTGAKGQDAGFLLIVVLSVFFASIGSTICGAIVFADQSPEFADWFDRHTVLGVIGTIVAIIPVAIVGVIAATVLLSVFLSLYVGIRKVFVK